MTIEATLERIANGIDILVAQGQTQVPATPVTTTVIPGAAAADTTKGRPRGRPPKVETPVAPAATPAAPAIDFGGAAETEDSFLDLGEAEPPKTYTREQVRDALVGYQKKTSLEVARKLLETLAPGVSLKMLPEADFARVIDAIAKA